MIITIQPDSENIEFIRANPRAQEIVKKLLHEAGVSENDTEQWFESHTVNLEPRKPFELEFYGMRFYVPESLQIANNWYYFIQVSDETQLLLINRKSFWAKKLNAHEINDLPTDLMNFSCRRWNPQSLSQHFNKFNQLRTLDLSSSSTLNNISHLANLKQIYSLNLENCESLSDITPLQNLTQLNSIDFSNCNALSDLAPLENLTQLNSLRFKECEFLIDITPLKNLTQLNLLRITNCELLINITPLEKLTQINLLNLSHCKSLSDITPLQKLTQLNSLDLSWCKSLSDITPLQKLTQLNSLDLSGCKLLSDITPLQNLTQLNSLNLSSCDSLIDITPLQNFTQLNSLDLSWCKLLSDITPLQNLTQLNSLNLSSCDSLIDITPLQNLTQLKSLNLSSCNSLIDITPLQYLTQLNSLNLSSCNSLNDITPLQYLAQLNSLNLSSCNSLTDITSLQNLTHLTSLKISGCKSLTDITPLKHLTSLNSLNLSGCDSLTDITPLKYLTSLNSLNLSGCDSLTDITSLKYLTQLNSLDLSRCKSLSDLNAIAEIKQLTTIDLSSCTSISNLSPIQFIEKLEEINIIGCLRVTKFPNFKQHKQLQKLSTSLHPTAKVDILAYCALSRADWSFFINDYYTKDFWIDELNLALKDSHSAAFDLATSLAIAFPHISFKLSESLCQILQTDPSLDYRPWKHLFLGVFQQMGFNFLQNLANTIVVGSWRRGAIGGLSAVAEQLITLPDGKEWFAGWVRATSAHHESNPSFLKPVAASWCLALHSLGENELLDQWIARFTIADGSSAFDAVFLEFGNHRLGLNDATGAFRHAIRIRATLVRDGLLADIASHYLAAQQADHAAELLFLLSAEDKRAELSLKLADIPNFLDNRDNLHRLLAACGKDAPAIGKLLEKAGMDEAVFHSDADNARQRAAQDAANMVSIRTGLGAAHVDELSDLMTQFLKNKANKP